MLEIKSSGSFSNTERFLTKASQMDISSILNSYGQAGVSALSSATPAETGLASQSWTYEIFKTSRGMAIAWHNEDVEGGSFQVARRIQIGYATGTGGYVQGRDYINPAMRPIFDKLAEQLWKAVTSE